MGNCVNRAASSKSLTISLHGLSGQDNFSDKYKVKNGSVVSSLKRHRNRDFFCKSYEKKKLDKFSEISVFENLDIMRQQLGYHPSFIKFIDFCDTTNEYKLIMEMYDGVDSVSYLHNKISRDDESVHRLIVMILQMVYSSLKFLHCRSLLHNDIRLSNILVSNLWSPVKNVFKSTSYFKLKGYKYSRVPKKQKLYHRLWSLSANAFSEGSSPGKPQSPMRDFATNAKKDAYQPSLTIFTEQEVSNDAIIMEEKTIDENFDNRGDRNKIDVDIYVDLAATEDPQYAWNYPFAKDNYAFGILIKELCTYSWRKSKVKNTEEIFDWREDLLSLRNVYEQLTDPQVSRRPMEIEFFESTMRECWENCWQT